MGKFQTGQEKPAASGRRKGVPNKKTMVLTESLESLGIDIVSKISELLPRLQPEKQVDVYLQLMQYVYPKKKAIELKGFEEINAPQVIVTLPSNGREYPPINHTCKF